MPAHFCQAARLGTRGEGSNSPGASALLGNALPGPDERDQLNPECAAQPIRGASPMEGCSAVLAWVQNVNCIFPPAQSQDSDAGVHVTLCGVPQATFCPLDHNPVRGSVRVFAALQIRRGKRVG